jgi:hypothetical protein
MIFWCFLFVLTSTCHKHKPNTNRQKRILVSCSPVFHYPTTPHGQYAGCCVAGAFSEWIMRTFYSRRGQHLTMGNTDDG